MLHLVNPRARPPQRAVNVTLIEPIVDAMSCLSWFEGCRELPVAAVDHVGIQTQAPLDPRLITQVAAAE